MVINIQSIHDARSEKHQIIPHTVHTSCHPTLQHHNSYNRTDNYRQRNAVGSPDDGHKDARNMLRYYWLPINHYLLHPVGFSFTYLSKMHGHSNITTVRNVNLQRSQVRKRGKDWFELTLNIHTRLSPTLTFNFFISTSRTRSQKHKQERQFIYQKVQIFLET